jgi:hypothetical protein
MKRVTLTEKLDKQQRIGRGAKQKGSRFERDICRAFSLWVSEYKRNDLFWRTAMSGGVAKIHGSDTQLGDVTAVHPMGYPLTENFVIECKWRKTTARGDGFGFGSFIFTEAPVIIRIWESEVDELASKNNRLPMLIAHPSNRSTIMVLNKVGWRLITQNKKVVPRLILPRQNMYFFRIHDILAIRFSLIMPQLKERVKP